MNITVKYKRNFAFVKIGSRRVDNQTAGVVENLLFEILKDDTNKIILDLSCVDFMDSRGLGVIIEASKAILSTGGEFRVCALSKQPFDLMKLLGLDQILDLYSPREFKVWKKSWEEEIKI